MVHSLRIVVHIRMRLLFCSGRKRHPSPQICIDNNLHAYEEIELQLLYLLLVVLDELQADAKMLVKYYTTERDLKRDKITYLPVL